MKRGSTPVKRSYCAMQLALQNGHDQQRNADYEIQFLICTHKHHLQTGSERVQHVPGFPVKCTIIFYIHRHVRQINN